MTAARDITALLVTYNSARILPWSLPSLADCPQVLVIDNHSSDDTEQTARRVLPQARVIQAGRNLGFGRANNMGLAAVTTDYALLLNPDARLAPGALDALHAAAQRYPEAAIIAPVLYDAPGVVGDFYRGQVPARGPTPEPDGDLCAEFVTGAAMLLNMRLMREVGFFDPWFFLYFEDDDLCRRARRAGHPIVVARAAQVEHQVRQSSTPSARNTLRRIYCMTLSKLYLARKYEGGAWAMQALRIGAGSLLALLPTLLTFKRERVLRQVARLAASAMAWRHLNRAHCFEPER